MSLCFRASTVLNSLHTVQHTLVCNQMVSFSFKRPTVGWFVCLTHFMLYLVLNIMTIKDVRQPAENQQVYKALNNLLSCMLYVSDL